MTARKACFVVSGVSALLVILLAAGIALVTIQGLLLGIAIIACMVLAGLSIAALVSAFHAKPGRTLEDNILLALIDLIILR